VYGWVFDESWHDIGNYEQLLEADNRLRAAAGLPVRTAYTPD
jgi:NDP-sugar pyrophosphorylase family protein